MERHPGHKQSLSIQRLSERNGETGSIRNFHLRTTGEDTWPRIQAFPRSFFFAAMVKSAVGALTTLFAMVVKAFCHGYEKKTVRESLGMSLEDTSHLNLAVILYSNKFFRILTFFCDSIS
jgi:hypothetical protein